MDLATVTASVSTVTASVSTVTVTVQSGSGESTALQTAIQSFALPIGVGVVGALFAYWLVNFPGEWRKRKLASKVGFAVLDALLDDVSTGLGLMRETVAAIDDPISSGPPQGYLPHESWSGMSTVSDEVLLRVIEVSRERPFKSFDPRKLRSHCKNYFVHIRENYGHALDRALAAGGNWRAELEPYVRAPRKYVEAAEGVAAMLEEARDRLDANSRRWRPW